MNIAVYSQKAEERNKEGAERVKRGRGRGRKGKGRQGKARKKLGSPKTKETKTHHQPHTPLPQWGIYQVTQSGTCFHFSKEYQFP